MKQEKTRGSCARSFLTGARGSKFLVWGLSAAMMSLALPAMAENPSRGGVKSLIFKQ